MIRGKRLYQENLLKMNGQVVLVADKVTGDFNRKHTVRINYEYHHTIFNALVSKNDMYYNISYEPIDNHTITEVYELINNGEEINDEEIIKTNKSYKTKII